MSLSNTHISGRPRKKKLKEEVPAKKKALSKKEAWVADEVARLGKAIKTARGKSRYHDQRRTAVPQATTNTYFGDSRHADALQERMEQHYHSLSWKRAILSAERRLKRVRSFIATAKKPRRKISSTRSPLDSASAPNKNVVFDAARADTVLAFSSSEDSDVGASVPTNWSTAAGLNKTTRGVVNDDPVLSYSNKKAKMPVRTGRRPFSGVPLDMLADLGSALNSEDSDEKETTSK